MIPTLAAVKTAFSFYNKKYFGGQLPTPLFSMKCPQNMWACFEPGEQVVTKFNKVVRYGYPCGTLCVTSVYSRDEKDILNSLLHEMVHMYVLFVLKKWPLNAHGSDFIAKAQQLNQDGWNIMAKNEMKDSDVLAGENEKSVGWSDKYIQQQQRAPKTTGAISQRTLNSMWAKIQQIQQALNEYQQQNGN